MSCLAWSLPSLYLFSGSAIPASLNIFGKCFHTCLCTLSLYNSTVTEEVPMLGWLGAVYVCTCMEFPACTLTLTCDPWCEGWVLKWTVEPSSSILLMLLCCGEVNFKWTSVTFLITGLEYSAWLLYRAKVFTRSSLVASYMYLWRTHWLPDMGMFSGMWHNLKNNCGEVSRASSVFCGPILGKVQTFC